MKLISKPAASLVPSIPHQHLTFSLALTLSLSAFLSLTFTSSSHAFEWSAELESETRYFYQKKSDSDQSDLYPSVAAQIDAHHDWDEGDQRAVVSLFSRVDRDAERTHSDVRELYWRKTFREADLDLYIGARQIFWGVTESVHLVNIINQTDLIENPDGEQKLGQPMIQATLDKRWGTTNVYIMPFFRERTFAGKKGRLRTPIRVVSGDNAQYESGARRKHLDWAVRWNHVLDDVDVGVAYFEGTDRNPMLVLVPNSNDINTVSDAALVPRYNQLKQVSIDAQYTKGPWLYKVEALNRDNANGSSQAMVSGIEYTLYGVLNSNVDVGIVAEYQYDNERTSALKSFDGEVPAALRQFDRKFATSINNNDMVLGARLAFNDTQSTSLLALATYDDSNNTKFYSIEAARRLSSKWSAAFQARIFSDTDDLDPTIFFSDDDYLDLTVTRYFD